MIEKLKTFYRELRDGEPGRRFTDFYDEHHRETKKSTLKKLVTHLLALYLSPLVSFFRFLQAFPGFPVVIVGAGMIAVTSRFISRLLDYSELKVRRLLGLEKS